MGVSLWGESPLYVNPASEFCTFAQVPAEGKGGTARDRPEEAGVQSDEPSLPRTRSGDVLMHRLSRKVRDKRVLRLIGKYLRAGVMIKGRLQDTQVGVPQACPEVSKGRSTVSFAQ